MERRDFFKSIAGLFAVAAIAPAALLSDEGSFYSNRPDANLAMIPKATKSDFVKLTQFMHGELLKQLPGGYPDVPTGGQKMSPDFPYQFGIDLDLQFDQVQKLSDDQITERYVLPAMTCMANEIKFKRAVKFAELPLPHGLDGACRVQGDGISLRGLRAFCLTDGYENEQGEWITQLPHYVHRFDVLFSA